MQVVETRATLLEEDAHRAIRQGASATSVSARTAELVEVWARDRKRAHRLALKHWLSRPTCRHGLDERVGCAYCAECSENEAVPPTAEQARKRNVARVQELKRVLVERTPKGEAA